MSKFASIFSDKEMATRRKSNNNTRRKKKSGKNGLSRTTKSYLASLCTLVLVLVALVSKSFSGCKTLNGGFLSHGHIPDLERVVTAKGTPEQIVSYEGMTISYNPAKHVPNWVAWELTADETRGKEPRAQNFQADESVAGCADPWDYSYSGYDRGHMAPASDMKWSRNAMKESFYMTNICPQVKSFNSGTWKRLEEKCRTWAQCDSAIVIIAGPVLTDSITESIGDNRVAVPKRFFKIIASPYANPPRGIAFILNNGKNKGGLQEAAVSIDSVESLTGHDFLSSLPDDIERLVESQCRFPYWSTLKPTEK